jgi:phospholipid/cholesterol/gamma-HCH transport system substrate-binding protein
VLKDLDDRKRAVEKDPRSPGGQGYTGFEALLQYVFDQTMAINAFDSNGYMLKVNLFLSQCSDYQNLQSLKKKLKENPSFYAQCAAILGPHQPGITQPDPSYTGAQETHEARELPVSKKSKSKKQDTPPKAPDVDDVKKDPRKAAEELIQNLEDTLGIDLPDLPPTNLPALPGLPALPVAPNGLPQAPSAADAQGLLDFLLAP